MFVIKLPKTRYYLAPSHRGIFGYTVDISKALKMKTYVAADIINTKHKGEITAIH